MDALEYAIRPYQTPGSHGKIIIPSGHSTTSARATITWGAKNSVLPKAQSVGFSGCCGDQYDEQQRQGSVVRITGVDPDDGPSYVDVFRTSQIQATKKSANGCDGPFDQYLNAEFAPFEGLGPNFVSGSDDGSDTPECGSKFNYTYSGLA